jgi:hypothetical protein
MNRALKATLTFDTAKKRHSDRWISRQLHSSVNLGNVAQFAAYRLEAENKRRTLMDNLNLNYSYIFRDLDIFYLHMYIKWHYQTNASKLLLLSTAST